MSKELKFKVGADTSRAVAGFEKIGAAAKKTKKDVREMTSSSKLSKEWKNADHAVSAYSKRLDEASRKTEKLTKQTSKWRAGVAKGLKWGAAAGAAGLVAGGYAVQAAAERERAVGRLAGTMGDTQAARGVANGLTVWARENGADPNELLKHVDRLMKAGLTADQAMSAIKSAVISAAGDASKIEGILEPLAEFTSKGFIEEQILDKFAELGVDLRGGLQEQLGMTREQLDKAVADHTITADAAIAAMQRLTAEGSRLHDSHAKSLEGMAGQMVKISGMMKELQIQFGTGIASGFQATMSALGDDIDNAAKDFQIVVESLGAGLGAVLGGIVQVLSSTIKGIINTADWLTEVFGGDLINDSWDEVKKPTEAPNWHAHKSAKWTERTATDARRKAASELAAKRVAERDSTAGNRLQKNLDALNKTAPPTGPRTRADIAREAGISGDVTAAALDEKIAGLGVASIQARQKRAEQLEKELAVLAQYGLTENSTKSDIFAKEIGPGGESEVFLALKNISMLGKEAGLGENATPAQIAAKIREDAVARESDIEKTDEAIRLQGLRDELAILEQEEKTLEAMRLEYEKRKEIQDALIAGDEKRAELLTQQAEAEKLAAQYAAKGFDMATAQQMAADEIARKAALSSKNANAQPVDPLARNVKLRETISSPLADIGGGGVRIRFYENQQLRAVTDTASATLSIRDISSQILTHLQTNQNKAILS